jgi:hypothetical protein
MERTECFGPCPNYSVIITGDGTVTYEGKKFVKVKGKRVLKISQEKLGLLVKSFYQIDYFSLKDRYDYLELGNGIRQHATDLPTTTTLIQINGRTKTISNYYGGPPSLAALEHNIEAIVGITEFIRKRKERLQ